MDPSRPHDSLFRQAFGDPRHATGLIRIAIGRDPALAALLPRIAWDRLERIDATVVDAADRPFQTDLLFAAPLLGPDGTETIVMFRAILEHKRKMDRQTAWQSTRYQIRTIEWHRSQPDGQDSWPIVITIVIYHGDVPWTAARELRELFEVPAWLPKKTQKTLRNLLPSGRYLLEDLRTQPDEPFDRRKLTVVAHVALEFLKHLPRCDLDTLRLHLTRLREHLVEIWNLPDGRPFLGSLFWYLMATTTSQTEGVRETIRTVLPEPVSNEMLNPLQKLLLERELVGEAKGEAKGKAEGRAEGRAEGEAKTLLRVLERRFGSVPADLRHRAHQATVEQLDRWVDRALDVARVEDVFAD